MVRATTTDYEKHFAGFFDRAAEIAREIALRYFRREIAVIDKDDSSPVTEADREIERNLRTLIAKAYPDHGIIGEEYGEDNAGAESVTVTWKARRPVRAPSVAVTSTTKEPAKLAAGVIVS